MSGGHGGESHGKGLGHPCLRKGAVVPLSFLVRRVAGLIGPRWPAVAWAASGWPYDYVEKPTASESSFCFSNSGMLIKPARVNNNI